MRGRRREGAKPPALLGSDPPDLDPNIRRVGTREFEVAEVARVRTEQNQRVDLGLRARAYVVTGGSRGLGFAAAEALVAEGACVVLSAPHQATASSAAERLAQGGASADRVAWIVADNADPATPDRLIERGEGALRPSGRCVAQRRRIASRDRRDNHRRCMAVGVRERLPGLGPARPDAGGRPGRRQRAWELTQRNRPVDRLRTGLLGARAASRTGRLQRAVPWSRGCGQDTRGRTRAGGDPRQRGPAGPDRHRPGP